MQEQGRAQTAGDAEGNRHHQEQRVAEVLPEVAVHGQAQEVFAASKAQRLVLEHVVEPQVPVGKGDDQAEYQRQQGEGQKTEDVGGQKGQPDGEPPLVVARHSSQPLNA